MIDREKEFSVQTQHTFLVTIALMVFAICAIVNAKIFFIIITGFPNYLFLLMKYLTLNPPFSHSIKPLLYVYFTFIFIVVMPLILLASHFLSLFYLGKANFKKAFYTQFFPIVVFMAFTFLNVLGRCLV